MSELSGPMIVVSSPDPEGGEPSTDDSKQRKRRRQREREHERRKNKKSKKSHSGSDSALTDGSGIEPSLASPSTLPPSAPSSPRQSPALLSSALPVMKSDTGESSKESTGSRKERDKARSADRRRKSRDLQKAKDLLVFSRKDLDEEKIQGWTDEEILKEASKLEGEILRGSGSDNGRIWLVDLDQRERARTPDKGIYEGKEPDLSEEKLNSEGWTILDRGTIYGYRTIDGKKSLVFAARFCPYSNMSEEELEEIRFLAKHFYWLGKLFNPVDTNAAMTGGLMFAEGWRFGYEALFSLGLYKLARNGAGTPEQYAKFLEDMERASAIYARRYKQLAPKEYLRSIQFVEESCVPRFGTVEPETANETSFGSNLTVTWGEFRNKYHYDNDASPRAAGSWFLTTDEGELVEDAETIRTAVQGGYFALPTFKFAVDFGSCPGVVDLMWSSMDDLHATSQSLTAPGFRRIGSSIQVPKRIADAAAKMKDMSVDQRPIAGKEIRMLELEMCL